MKQTKKRKSNAVVPEYQVLTPKLYTPGQLCQGYAKGLGVRLVLDALKDCDHPLPHYRLSQKTVLIAISDFQEWLDHRAVSSFPPPGARASSLQVAK